MICPKCFETNEDSAEFCAECGAPLREGADASEQGAYKDLARANLLRMRGDTKAAADVCLSILKRYPNNPTAHSLLGDIYADQGDLQQASTWYEMALDITPDNAADRQKLASVRELIHLREQAQTAEQIGLKPTPPRPWPLVILVVVAALAVATGAYVIGRAQQDAAGRDMGKPVVDLGSTSPAPSPSPPVSRPTESVPAAPPKTAGPDAALLQSLQNGSSERLNYVSAWQDPRGPVATVTVQASAYENPHVTAIKAGLDLFKVAPAYTRVTLRVLGESGLVLVADLTKDAATTAQAALNGGDTLESQAQVMLSNVWTPPVVGGTTGAGAPNAQSAGGTSPGH